MSSDVQCTLQNTELSAVIDTRLQHSVISDSQFRRLSFRDCHSRFPSTVRLSAADGQPLCVIGQYTLQISFGTSKTFDITVLVVPGFSCDLIIGMDFLRSSNAKVNFRSASSNDPSTVTFAGSKPIPVVGYLVSVDGIRPHPDTVRAIVQFPVPTDVTSLRSFMSLVGSFRFIPNMSELAFHLRRLLERDVPWNWTQECLKEFEGLRIAVRNAATIASFSESFASSPLYPLLPSDKKVSSLKSSSSTRSVPSPSSSSSCEVIPRCPCCQDYRAQLSVVLHGIVDDRPTRTLFCFQSAHSFVSLDFFKQLSPSVITSRFRSTIRSVTVNGVKSIVRWCCLLPISFGSDTIRVPVFVVDHHMVHPLILGRNFLRPAQAQVDEDSRFPVLRMDSSCPFVLHSSVKVAQQLPPVLVRYPFPSKCKPKFNVNGNYRPFRLRTTHPPSVKV